ncbi:MAG: NifU family protein [Candidatus Omnitrophica bacterium]|nr:NifU family protein [Candidatus Omnitrophota bacterium]
MKEEIEEILDKEVRPLLALEGGGIEIVEIKDDIVKVKFTGGCSMCPFINLTLKGLVEKVIKSHFPHIEKVEPV